MLFMPSEAMSPPLLALLLPADNASPLKHSHIMTEVEGTAQAVMPDLATASRDHTSASCSYHAKPPYLYGWRHCSRHTIHLCAVHPKSQILLPLLLQCFSSSHSTPANKMLRHRHRDRPAFLSFLSARLIPTTGHMHIRDRAGGHAWATPPHCRHLKHTLSRSSMVLLPGFRHGHVTARHGPGERPATAPAKKQTPPTTVDQHPCHVPSCPVTHAVPAQAHPAAESINFMVGSKPLHMRAFQLAHPSPHIISSQTTMQRQCILRFFKVLCVLELNPVQQAFSWHAWAVCPAPMPIAQCLA
jgi:hypothetical protein